jgi:hypothetical protein
VDPSHAHFSGRAVVTFPAAAHSPRLARGALVGGISPNDIRYRAWGYLSRRFQTFIATSGAGTLTEQKQILEERSSRKRTR